MFLFGNRGRQTDRQTDTQTDVCKPLPLAGGNTYCSRNCKQQHHVESYCKYNFMYQFHGLYLIHLTGENVENLFNKPITKLATIKVCDGIINLQINYL